jgi:hypothetical protein
MKSGNYRKLCGQVKPCHISTGVDDTLPVELLASQTSLGYFPFTGIFAHMYF